MLTSATDTICFMKYLVQLNQKSCCDMVRVYLTDILATDKQLASEIEFDLRKFEQQEKESQKQQRRSNVAVSYFGISTTFI